MNVYQILRWESDSTRVFKRTRADAVDFAKRHGLHKVSTTEIVLISIPTDAEAIVSILNGDFDDLMATKGKTLKVWNFTPRGGLKEVPESEW